jgi:hypothetical protein
MKLVLLLLGLGLVGLGLVSGQVLGPFLDLDL